MRLFRLLYFTILLGCGLSSLANAQPSTAANLTATPKVVYKNNTVFWRDSVLVRHQDGQFTPVTGTIRFPNGNSISEDGSVQLANGKIQKLKSHQALNPQGKIVLAADDIFTIATIQQTEQQVVGDTETKLFLINGEPASVTSGTKELNKLNNSERQIRLLEQMNSLLEQRATLLNNNLTEAQQTEINAQRKLLDAKIAAIDRRLKAKPANNYK